MSDTERLERRVEEIYSIGKWLFAATISALIALAANIIVRGDLIETVQTFRIGGAF